MPQVTGGGHVFARPNPPTGPSNQSPRQMPGNLMANQRGSFQQRQTLQPLHHLNRPLQNNNNNIKLQPHSPRGLFPIPTFEETLSPTAVPYEAIERVLSAHSTLDGGIV